FTFPSTFLFAFLFTGIPPPLSHVMATQAEDQQEGPPDFMGLQYRTLQGLCKQRGLKAKGSKDTLVERLIRDHERELENSNHNIPIEEVNPPPEEEDIATSNLEPRESKFDKFDTEEYLDIDMEIIENFPNLEVP